MTFPRTDLSNPVWGGKAKKTGPSFSRTEKIKFWGMRLLNNQTGSLKYERDRVEKNGISPNRCEKESLVKAQELLDFPIVCWGGEIEELR